MGSIVNYMQLDTSRLESVVHSIHTVWDGALQVRWEGMCVLTMYILYSGSVCSIYHGSNNNIVCSVHHTSTTLSLLPTLPMNTYYYYYHYYYHHYCYYYCRLYTLTPTPATTIDHRLHVLAGAVPGPLCLRRHRSHVRHPSTQLLLPA